MSRQPSNTGKLILFALVILILFQLYFAYFFIIGEGSGLGISFMGYISLLFSIFLIYLAIKIYKAEKQKSQLHHKKHNDE